MMFYGRYNDLLKHYNTPLSQFVLHTSSDLTSLDMLGNTLDFTANAWPQQVKFALHGHLFTHLGFQSVWVVLGITFNPGFVDVYYINLHTHDLTSSDMTGYSTTDAWPHQVNCTLPGHLITHLAFPECS